MNGVAIRTEGLTREFGQLRAVDDLTLQVPAGIVFGFLGPNGSGKTTTIRLLLGLIGATRGSAHVLGFHVARQAEAVRARAGALLEHTGLYERLTAEENLEYAARIARMSAADRAARIKELLGATGLWERRRDPVRQWSRGMKQKLAVARALLHRPPLVFLDEPTAGLDPVAAAALRTDLGVLVERQGTTVFLTTHNLTEAEKLCHQVAVIRGGRLLAVGEPGSLRQQGVRNTVAVFTGRGFDERVAALLRQQRDVSTIRANANEMQVELRPGADLAPLVSAVVAAGAMVEEVRRPRATLEDQFLDLVEEEQVGEPAV